MNITFKNFKEHVLLHRRNKIREEDYDKVFNADVFTGDEAIKFGLADEIGDLDTVMKEKYPGVEIINFSKESSFEALKNKFGKADADTNSSEIVLKMLQTLKEFKSI